MVAAVPPTGRRGPSGWLAWAAWWAEMLAIHLPCRVLVLVGVGVSNAEQAYQATRVADGVIQGASVVRRLMDSGPDAVGDYVAEVRACEQFTHRSSLVWAMLQPQIALAVQTVWGVTDDGP